MYFRTHILTVNIIQRKSIKIKSLSFYALPVHQEVKNIHKQNTILILIARATIPNNHYLLKRITNPSQ